MTEPANLSTNSGSQGIPDRSETFVHGMNFNFQLEDEDRRASGRAVISDVLRTPSGRWPRSSYLLTIADCAVGIASCFTMNPRLPVTVDISVRLLTPPAGDVLDIDVSILKVGRTVTTGVTRFLDAETGTLVASSFATFAASPRPQDTSPEVIASMNTEGTMPLPFPEFVGARVIEPGVAEVALTPFLFNAAQALQGGIVALLGELAAETLANRDVIELDVRYLSAVRVGPGVATATRLSEDVLEVEVRDGGRDDRLVGLITARLGDEPR